MSVLSLLTAYYVSRLPPSDYFAELPALTDYLPDELHSSFLRLQTLVGDVQRPGLKAREGGIRAHYPVVLIPGIISTALEVWEGEACARPHFRQRLWGSALMLRSILLDTRCWIRHMMLDPKTGLDPPGIKLRSSSGLEAADYLIGGFWVWAKLIENLGDIGYDTNSMSMAPYDWRLAFRHLQVRDFYFSKLKAQIELLKLANRGRKAVLITHSMGALVVHYFMQWVQSERGGGAGSRWVHDHVQAVANIGGPMLGVPKAWSALFSGEMKDTAELAPFLDYWRQRVVFSQADVIQIMRAVFSVPSMMPKGGDELWGDGGGSPDDFFCKKYADVTRLLTQGANDSQAADIDDEIVREYCHVLPHLARNTSTTERSQSSLSSALPEQHEPGETAAKAKAAEHYADGSLQMAPSGHSVGQSFSAMLEDSILRHPSRWFTSHKEQRPYTSGTGTERGAFVTFTSEGEKEAGDGGKDGQCTGGRCELTMDGAMALLRQTAAQYMNFTDSLYSFGNDVHADQTDQRHWSNPLESPLPYAPNMTIYCLYGVGRETERGYVYRHSGSASSASSSSSSSAQDRLVPHWSINSSHTAEQVNIRSGIKFTDGDGTVPLISLGFMCSAGWRSPSLGLNPSAVRIVTREYLEVNATMAILRAATSTDHVDIMGNSDIIADLLAVVGVRRKGADASREAAEEQRRTEQQMRQRKEDIDSENEGRKPEEKGPKTPEEQETEAGHEASAAQQQTESREAQATAEDLRRQQAERQQVEEADADVNSDWQPTYHDLKDRVLSCVREISVEAEQRLLKKLGLSGGRAAAQREQQMRTEAEQLSSSSGSSS